MTKMNSYTYAVLGGMVLFVIALMLMPQGVWAQGIGDLARNVGDQADGVAFGGKQIALLIGFIAVLASVVMFMTRHKSQTPMGVPIGFLLGGILLMSIGAWIESGSETVFKSNKTQIDEIGIK